MFWIVGFDSKTDSIAILDDTDNVVEWLSVDKLNYTLRNDYSIDIDYKEGSIVRKNKYTGITKNGRTCLGLDSHRRYCVFDFYKRLIVLSDIRTMFKEPIFLYDFGITDIDSTSYFAKIWFSILERCYYSNNPNYSSYGAKGVYVDKSFQRASKFALWYKNQPNSIFRFETKLDVDKDLLGKKYYGEDSCVLLPQNINIRLGKLNRCNTTSLPRFCSSRGDCVQVRLNHKTIKEKDTSYVSSFYENLVIDFLDSRGITEWKYATSMEDVGRKWITAKNISFSRNKEACDESLQKDWITKDYYDRLLDTFDVKITDWGLYEDH